MSHHPSARARLLRRLTVWLCLVLVLVAGTASLLHVHSVGEAVDPACSLCVVAHLAQAPVPEVNLPVLVARVVLARPPDMAVVPPRQLPFDLSVRPPPARTAHV